MRTPPVIVSIAGFDPSSGAGVTADVKTAAAHGCYAATCITALTVQNTQGVSLSKAVDAELVRDTLLALDADLQVSAVHIGMLGSGEIASAVADFLDQVRWPNVVLDPVVRSSSGKALIDDSGLEVLRARLIPRSDVVTPNVYEAATLTGEDALEDNTTWELALPRIRRLATSLHDMKARKVIITGGHLVPANDYVSFRSMGHAVEAVLRGDHLESSSTHGTGCAYATTLACRLTLGDDLPQAARGAKEYVRKAIAEAYPLGKGTGPVNHFA